MEGLDGDVVGAVSLDDVSINATEIMENEATTTGNR